MKNESWAKLSRNSRVLMLGIDAMSLPFARVHLDQLPTLKALIQRGVLVEPEIDGEVFQRQHLADLRVRQERGRTWPIFSVSVGRQTSQAKAAS